MKKTAKKKKRWEVVCDLVDCWIDDVITKDEFIEKLTTLAEKERNHIIKIDEEKSYRCIEAKTYGKHEGKGYFLQFKWWEHDEWCDVTDLSELKIWEYNKLVDELNKHYPDYPIEYLEGRFV